MVTFTKYFNINKTQAELDFVDVDLDCDTPLYIDPYALTTKDDDFSINCHSLVVSFFETVLLAIKDKNLAQGVRLLSHLGEPEETKLGVSLPGNKGRGIGPSQAKEIFTALQGSKAAQTGLLEDLTDFALFVPLIGRDKISDMTTNIIRGELILYTQTQCKLLGIPLRTVPSGFYWDGNKAQWKQSYVDLPVTLSGKILLVPKYMVRYQVSVDHATYRSKFVLEFMQEEHLRADSSLVTAIKNKKGNVTKKVVYKKDVDAICPKDKDFLAQFSLEHPEVIDEYKDHLKSIASKIPNIAVDSIDEYELCECLIQQLENVPPGVKSANVYHNLMIGIISFIFFPNLIYPQKEAPINEGRKRIDITYTNGKISGFFYRLSLDQDIRANIIHVECKNYTDEITNPEFDQLLGRFDHSRGKLGLLIYRSADKPDIVINRCRDAAKSKLGLILPLDDNFIKECLRFIQSRQRSLIDKKLNDLYSAIVS